MSAGGQRQRVAGRAEKDIQIARREDAMLRRVLMPDEGRQVRQNRDVNCNDAPRRSCRRMGFHVARIQRGRDETVFGPAPRRKIAGRAARFLQQRDIGLSPTRHLHQFVPGFRALADIPAVRLRQEPHRRLRRDPGRTHSNASGQDPSRVIHTRSSMPHRCTGRDCNSSGAGTPFVAEPEKSRPGVKPLADPTQHDLRLTAAPAASHSNMLVASAPHSTNAHWHATPLCP